MKVIVSNKSQKIMEFYNIGRRGINLQMFTNHEHTPAIETKNKGEIKKGISDTFRYSNKEPLTFWKTADEVSEKCTAMLATLKERIKQTQSQLDDMLEEIDQEPEEKPTWEIERYKIPEDEVYYQFPWGMTYKQEQSYNIGTQSSDDEIKKIADYNNLVSTYCCLWGDYNFVDFFSRNITEEEYELTYEQAQALGF